MVAYYQALILSQMVELGYIAFIALAAYGYHIVVHYGTIFQGLNQRIRERYGIASTDYQPFIKQWFDHVLLGACPMCVAGNLAVLSCFAFHPEGLLMGFIRIFGSITLAIIINSANESKGI
jgi:ABC-type branched-subunit amino acid transport system permease subunit